MKVPVLPPPVVYPYDNADIVKPLQESRFFLTFDQYPFANVLDYRQAKQDGNIALKSFLRYHVISGDSSLSSCHWYAEFIARISARRGLPRTHTSPYIRSWLEAYRYDRTSLWRYWSTGRNASCRMSPSHKRHAHIRDRLGECSDFGPCNQETLRLFALYCKPTGPFVSKLNAPD